MIIKKTVTSIFMVPTLKIGKETLEKNNFIDAYTEDFNCSIDYKDVVFLLFKPKDLNIFKDFLENEYVRTKSIIEDYDYKEGYVVVVYQLDGSFKKDFDLIKSTKYSKTSQEFQKLFPEIVNLNGKETQSIQYLIFKKDKKLIDFWENVIGSSFLSSLDLEVWTAFSIENETLNIKEHYENKTDITG